MTDQLLKNSLGGEELTVPFYKYSTFLIATILILSAISYNQPKSSANAQPNPNDYIVTEWETNKLSKITPDGVRTEIYSFTGSTGAEDVAIDSEGNYIVAEYINDKLSKITPDGVRTEIYSFASGTGPDGFAIDSEGNYIVEEGLISGLTAGKLSKVTLSGVRTEIYSFVSGTYPDGVAIDSEGNYIIAEGLVDKLSKITPNGVRTEIFSFSRGTFPEGVAIDSAGNYIVAEYGANKLSKISPDGVRTEIYSFGSGTKPSGVAIESVHTPPLTITVSVSNVMKKSLSLAWTESTNPKFEKYEVFKSIVAGILGTSIANITNEAVTSLSVTNLSPSTTYYFIVRVWDTEGLYTDSTQISATTAASPTAVTVSVSGITENSLKLTWTQSSDSFFARHEVFQSSTQDSLGTSIVNVTDKSSTSFTVGSLSLGTTYYFTVRTIDVEGLYADSTAISVTIAVPFWQQPWFIGLIIAIVAVVIVTILFMKRRGTTAKES
jgi:sugar lactone lactonase YvrE